jgi:hypothetical protein
VTHGDKRLRGRPPFNGSQRPDRICPRLAVVMAIFIDDRQASGEPNAVFTCATSVANATRSATCGRLYSEDSLLQRLAQDFQNAAPELGQLIQEAHAMVRQRHLTRHGDLAAADQPHRRGGVRRGATRVQGVITV